MSAAAELRGMREDAFDPRRTAELRASREAVAAWERAHPAGLDDALDRLAEIQERFGTPPGDRRPWRGDDFRL